ncbi:hypothetical protein CVT24_000377 [Panaeolus cyanescens]|uniref:MI domain-containing protein n=1 Tax=Panaeolus cyanescens TaxID=181874 RepID=A0A409YD04_9AGAR|nr:hypothetical protein CVT24_000377 [Panaeolus cyanescens]
MAIRKTSSTTRLPQSLLEQIEGSAQHNHSHHGSRKVSRKDLRKQDRQERKQKKSEFFSRNPRKRPAEAEQVDSTQRKKPRTDIPNPTPPPPPHAPRNTPSVVNTSKGKGRMVTRPSTSSSRDYAPPTSSRPPHEDKEDRYIAYLESKLRAGGKKKHKEEDDGLDDLLNFADSIALQGRQAYTPNIQVENTRDSDIYGESEGTASEDSEQYSEDDSWGDEWGGIEQSSNSDEREEPEPNVASTDPLPSQSPAASSTAYIPPHLRQSQASQDESLAKLTRQLKGQLNRMSEQNIAIILSGVEDIYRTNGRNDVTTTLTNLIIDGICSHSTLLDSYVVLYAAFVSSLHKIIGIEFAAHFVQTVISKYEQHYRDVAESIEDVSKDGKECTNLMVLISELYNFQVISCLLVFDIIKAVLQDDLSELKIELLLKLLRNSGQQLRQDDPTALKDIIQTVQDKVSNQDGDLSSRTRFMIETLTNLKNNKLKRNITQNQGASAVERMKKFLSGLSKTKHILSHEPLRVSLEDLHSADKRGKWWLVGAAWSGNPLVERQEEFQKVVQEDQSVEEQKETDLVKLARSQGMNTDIRKGIFVVLLSSADYLDACERLGQLKLTEVQQREIFRVILHCCGQEKSYNPYYTLVGQQLCKTAHSHKITLQYMLWDFLRELGESNVGGAAMTKISEDFDNFSSGAIAKSRMQNVCKAYAWWIAKDCINLNALKPLDFTRLKAQTRSFLRDLLINVFVNSQRAAPVIGNSLDSITFTRNRNAIEEIFIKATRVQNVAMGLVYFMSEALIKESDGRGGLDKFIKWAAEVAQETLRTGIDVVPVL